MSSIGMREEQIGYRAAEGLIQQIDALARGEDPPVFHDIIPPHAVEERQTTSLKMIADPAIAKAVNYLMDHALTGATITDAARASGVNRRTMERGFKRHLGITPNAYVLDLKIAHAKNLLESTDLPLRNIAEACRFSQEHFTRFFQQQTGLTPSAYRKRNTLPRCL
jgi:LacI family transcriptional regulator